MINPIRTATALRAGICLLGFAWASVSVGRAATWFVSGSASGANNGTTMADAWVSLAAVTQSSLNSGDTVLVYPGTYNERFTISRGGASASSRITYKGVGHPVLRGVNGQSFGYIALIGFEFTQLSEANNYRAITLSNAEGWLIQDNYFHDTFEDAIVGLYNTINSHNIVRCNRMDNIGSVSGGAANNAMISFYGDSNLIEYNVFQRGLDRVYCFGSGNIVRNNLDTGTIDALFPKTRPYPYHIDFFQTYDSTRLLQQLLVERNFVRDNIGGNGHFFIAQDEANQGMNWIVIRGNVVVRMGSYFGLMQHLSSVAVYNNTADAIQFNAARMYNNGFYFNAPTGGDSYDFRNNIFCDSPNTMDAAGIIPMRYRPTHLTADYQNRHGAGRIPSAAHNVDDVNPLFNEPEADNYTLQAKSPMRSAGGPITSARGAGGNSTLLVVAEAKRLVDGWGIAEPDWIKMGSGPYVQISSIDYATGVVTLSEARSWDDGAPVYLKGTEDIGALPYEFATSFQVRNTTPRSLPAGLVTLSAICTNPDAVRKVEFLVDGIPVGTAYSTSGRYSVVWTADGAPHSVEARAYNAWASQTLYQSSFSGTPGGTDSASRM